MNTALPLTANPDRYSAPGRTLGLFGLKAVRAGGRREDHEFLANKADI